MYDPGALPAVRDYPSWQSKGYQMAFQPAAQGGGFPLAAAHKTLNDAGPVRPLQSSEDEKRARRHAGWKRAASHEADDEDQSYSDSHSCSEEKEEEEEE